tara:strand:+ start:174035 stop:174565 length:531 start_codon:yes stop_codon:yes gene_type:complete
MDLRELLSEYGYDGEEIPVVRVSAKQAHDGPTDPEAIECIEQLLDALDRWIPDPIRLDDKPFLMPIENVYSIAGRGTVVTGKIEQGMVRAGDIVEILGLNFATTTDVITQVESFGEVLEVASAGESIGVLLRKTAHNDITKGQVFGEGGNVNSALRIRGRGLRADEGRRMSAHAIL